MMCFGLINNNSLSDEMVYMYIYDASVELDTIK